MKKSKIKNLDKNHDKTRSEKFKGIYEENNEHFREFLAVLLDIVDDIVFI